MVDGVLGLIGVLVTMNMRSVNLDIELVLILLQRMAVNNVLGVIEKINFVGSIFTFEVLCQV